MEPALGVRCNGIVQEGIHTARHCSCRSAPLPYAARYLARFTTSTRCAFPVVRALWREKWTRFFLFQDRPTAHPRCPPGLGVEVFALLCPKLETVQLTPWRALHAKGNLSWRHTIVPLLVEDGVAAVTCTLHSNCENAKRRQTYGTSALRKWSCFRTFLTSVDFTFFVRVFLFCSLVSGLACCLPTTTLMKIRFGEGVLNYSRGLW